MSDNMSFEDKLQRLAELIHTQQVESLHRRDLACEGNLANARTRVVKGRKYTKIDVGNPDSNYWSGKYMVENDTGRIYGIKGYGVIHRGHYFGTLDTIDEWAWGEYRAGKRAEGGAARPPAASEVETAKDTGGIPAGGEKVACDLCAREFEGETREEAEEFTEAHKAIAHKPEPPYEENFTRPMCAECGLAPVAPNSARDWCAKCERDDDPPTGTDGGGSAPLPDSSARVLSFPARAELRAASTAEVLATGQHGPNPPALYASLATLRALKLINDGAVLEERKKGDEPSSRARKMYSDILARVTLNGVECVLNVAKLDKWAATFEPGTSFTFELSEQGLTLTSGTSFIRFVAGGVPFALTPIELTADYSVLPAGELVAPALPSPESMKAARKALSEGRKALREEKARLKAIEGVNVARSEVRRAEEYAAKLEREAAETIQRAEELSEQECEEAVVLAKRVRDLRRLRRAVEQAAEDPMVNTPEFFDWLTEEHKQAYAEAFTKFEKAVARVEDRSPRTMRRNGLSTYKRNQTLAAKAKRAVWNVLWDAFCDYALPLCAGLYSEDDGALSLVVALSHESEPQAVKRALRRFPSRMEYARESVARARERVREALEACEPHVKPEERERYNALLAA